MLNPIEIDDGRGGTETVLWARSRFDLQPLLTEDDEPDLTGPEHVGTHELVIVR